MEIKEIINVIKTEFKKSKLSSILNKGESYLIEDYVQFIATCPMALPFAENYKFANKEFNKEYYDLFDSVEAWKNLKGKGYKKFLQVADDDIIVDEKITFGIDVCVTDNSINYYILTHEFEDPFFKEYPLYFGNEKELKFILGTVFDNLSLMESKTSSRKSIKESSDVAEKISSEIDKSYWIDKLIDDLDRHYEAMEKAWLKNLDKLSDEDILGIIDDCMGKSKTLVGKSEMLKNKMIDDLSKAYDDYIDDIDRQIRIGKSEDEIKDMIESTLENDIKMYLKLAYNNKASSNYFMVKFAEDNLI